MVLKLSVYVRNVFCHFLWAKNLVKFWYFDFWTFLAKFKTFAYISPEISNFEVVYDVIVASYIGCVLILVERGEPQLYCKILFWFSIVFIFLFLFYFLSFFCFCFVFFFFFVLFCVVILSRTLSENYKLTKYFHSGKSLKLPQNFKMWILILICMPTKYMLYQSSFHMSLNLRMMTSCLAHANCKRVIFSQTSKWSCSYSRPHNNRHQSNG